MDTASRVETQISADWVEAVSASIERSRPMLDWPDNWDGEGSPAYGRETWNRAVDFILRSMRGYWLLRQAPAAVPVIAPGPNGSIDVVWERPDRRLVVNIPVAPDEPSSYYGAIDAGETVEGMLNISADNQWLMN